MIYFLFDSKLVWLLKLSAFELSNKLFLQMFSETDFLSYTDWINKRLIYFELNRQSYLLT